MSSVTINLSKPETAKLVVRLHALQRHIHDQSSWAKIVDNRFATTSTMRMRANNRTALVQLAATLRRSSELLCVRSTSAFEVTTPEKLVNLLESAIGWLDTRLEGGFVITSADLDALDLCINRLLDWIADTPFSVRWAKPVGSNVDSDEHPLIRELLRTAHTSPALGGIYNE